MLVQNGGRFGQCLVWVKQTTASAKTNAGVLRCAQNDKLFVRDEVFWQVGSVLVGWKCFGRLEGCGWAEIGFVKGFGGLPPFEA